MTNVKLPCPIGTVLYCVEVKKKYIITKYEIRGLKNSLFAVCKECGEDNFNETLFCIENGKFINENVFIAELPDYELMKSEFLNGKVGDELKWEILLKAFLDKEK